MDCLEDTMLLGVNKRTFLLSILSPQQEHKASAMVIQPMDYCISQLSPALERVQTTNSVRHSCNTLALLLLPYQHVILALCV